MALVAVAESLVYTTRAAKMPTVAIEVNSFFCLLQVKASIQETELPSGAFRFTVEFQRSDGSSFALAASCGADASDTPVQTRFDYTVQAEDGRFRVLELPVYIP